MDDYKVSENSKGYYLNNNKAITAHCSLIGYGKVLNGKLEGYPLFKMNYGTSKDGLGQPWRPKSDNN